MTPKEIKELRLSFGETQEQFAHRLNTTFNTINRWERGKTKPHRFLMKELERLNSLHKIIT